MHIDLLKKEFERRKAINKSYSLRAFAKFLEIDSGSLSAILKRCRPIPISKINVFADKLGLSDTDRQIFLNSIADDKNKRKQPGFHKRTTGNIPYSY